MLVKGVVNKTVLFLFLLLSGFLTISCTDRSVLSSASQSHNPDPGPSPQPPTVAPTVSKVHYYEKDGMERVVPHLSNNIQTVEVSSTSNHVGEIYITLDSCPQSSLALEIREPTNLYTRTYNASCAHNVLTFTPKLEELFSSRVWILKLADYDMKVALISYDMELSMENMESNYNLSLHVTKDPSDNYTVHSIGDFSLKFTDSVFWQRYGSSMRVLAYMDTCYSTPTAGWEIIGTTLISDGSGTARIGGAVPGSNNFYDCLRFSLSFTENGMWQVFYEDKMPVASSGHIFMDMAIPALQLNTNTYFNSYNGLAPGHYYLVSPFVGGGYDATATSQKGFHVDIINNIMVYY